jgi:hypothetical protein
MLTERRQQLVDQYNRTQADMANLKTAIDQVDGALSVLQEQAQEQPISGAPASPDAPTPIRSRRKEPSAPVSGEVLDP